MTGIWLTQQHFCLGLLESSVNKISIKIVSILEKPNPASVNQEYFLSVTVYVLWCSSESFGMKIHRQKVL